MFTLGGGLDGLGGVSEGEKMGGGGGEGMPVSEVGRGGGGGGEGMPLFRCSKSHCREITSSYIYFLLYLPTCIYHMYLCTHACTILSLTPLFTTNGFAQVPTSLCRHCHPQQP